MTDKPENPNAQAPAAQPAPAEQPTPPHIISLEDALEVCRNLRPQCAIAATKGQAWLVAQMEYAQHVVQYSKIAAVVPSIFIAAAPQDTVLRMVTYINESVCRCGHRTLLNKIPIGARYLISMRGFGLKGQYTCGGCKQTTEIETVLAWSITAQSCELRRMPAGLLDIIPEASTCRPS